MPRPLAFYINPREPVLEQELAWLQGHGISHIGTNSMPTDDLPNLHRMSNLMEKYGMSMVSIHSEFGLLSPDGDDAALRPLLCRTLERAHAWNSDCVVVHFRSIQQPWQDGIWWQENFYIHSIGVQTIDRRQEVQLTWLCEEAQKIGTKITLENVPIHFAFAYRVDEIVDIVQRIGAPNLGVCLDSGHAHMSGVDVPSAVLCAGEKLFTTHFHDTFTGLAPRALLKDSDLHLVPGLGTIKWPAVLHALDEVGYSQPIVFEGPRIPGNSDKFEAWSLTCANWCGFEHLAVSKT